MISYQEELSRLNNSKNDVQNDIQGFTVKYSLYSDNPSLLNDKVKEVLHILISKLAEVNNLDDLVLDCFPDWLQYQFTAELTEEEYKQRIDEWRNNPDSNANQFDEWSFKDWLYWMEPDNRYWLWDSSKLVEDKLIVSLEIEDWPIAIQALEWFFKAAGAKKIEHTLSPE